MEDDEHKRNIMALIVLLDKQKLKELIEELQEIAKQQDL